MIKNSSFQTPPWVCDVMVSLVDGYPQRILEPTPGTGNLVAAIYRKFPQAEIFAVQTDFFQYIQDIPVDIVIANPPFSPMSLGLSFLLRFFNFAPNVIALMPWFTVINSQKRTDILLKKGLCKIVHLPRSAFPHARVQTCILKFSEDFDGDITLLFCSPPLHLHV